MAFEADEVAFVVFRARFELTLFDVSDVLVEVRAVWRVPSRNREGGGQKCDELRTCIALGAQTGHYSGSVRSPSWGFLQLIKNKS